ncbi:MAG: hypothetical protein PSV22_05140 [Pseudolabrys sp.]|jgi:hypothetical protein|nr:hypothetical protein [Pseudolabrys sp.]
MLTKTKIALSALLVVGFASAAMASDASEAAGQTYSFAASTARHSAGALTYAYAPAKATVKAFSATERAQFARATEAGLNH